VLEKLDRYEDRGLPFASWVYRVAHNHLVDYYRTLPKQGTISIDDCYNLAEKEAERSLDQTLTHNELSKALKQLTDDQRRVVVLRFLQGMNILETARTIGKTEDAVKKLQARGLMALRRALGARALAELAAYHSPPDTHLAGARIARGRPDRGGPLRFHAPFMATTSGARQRHENRK
jgi:RNA polymerase sigma-70 factor (ECF subfamily)